MKLTLICHFYNEEFLLPFFVKHYVKMVDRAIMIDYASTDNSRQIIKELAPHWEIRASRNKVFIEPQIGLEVMDIEKEIDDWKMCLNVTEFILHPNLKNYLSKKGMAVKTTGVYMVDALENQDAEIKDEPLVMQRHHGYFEDEVYLRRWRPDSEDLTNPPPRKARLIHRHKTGEYGHGRHNTKHNVPIDPNLILCWYNWSPMKHIRHRRVQIGQKMPPREHGKSYYFNSEDQVQQQYLWHARVTENLLERPRYKKAYDAYKDSL